MKNRRKQHKGVISWSTFFWCTLIIIFFCILFTTLTFPFVRSFYISELFQPNTNTPLKWRTSTVKSKPDNSPPTIRIRDIVMLTDQALVFLNYPPSFRFYSKEDINCIFFSIDSSNSKTQVTKPPIKIDEAQSHDEQIIRCPLPPQGYTISLASKSNILIPITKDSSTHGWDPLVYEALFDRDNSTIVFVKGLNLRSERLANPSSFQCIYGWDFKNPKLLLSSSAISVAQEIIRCETPVSILNEKSHDQDQTHSLKVSVKIKDDKIFPSIAKPMLQLTNSLTKKKAHKLCLCTVLRNQARFLKEWVMYHYKIGFQRWFIYDNNSDDDIDKVIDFLQSFNYNITRHLWPWVKTQEAGFAHCALRARASCEWVGFIDVDEFYHAKIEGGLKQVVNHHAKLKNVGEIRTSCYSFGPSGLKEMPRKGVMVGYTCRLLGSERHKSIVKPEAINQSLINVVHHFHLRTPFVSVDVDKHDMVINHYKYQVWEVFKEKFYRRVATYVEDWQNEKNEGSKDRVPGLGTKAVEPKDWPNRFCEVQDPRLSHWVLRNFIDRRTRLLPWEPEFEQHVRKRRRRKFKGLL